MSDKIIIFNEMIGNLKLIATNNENVIKNEEELASLKNNVEGV